LNSYFFNKDKNLFDNFAIWTKGSIGNGKINLINFFEGYPTKTVILDVSALSKVMNKVESISELLTFFTNSPLEKIKTN